MPAERSFHRHLRDTVTARQQQKGFSLVELMVSVTLGLIVLSAVLIVFANASASRNEVERTTRQIENGRYASELLSDDIRLAGFYGEVDLATVAAPGALPADPCSVAAADWNAWMRIHIQGFDVAGFTSANCALPNQKAGTDVLVIRRARTCTANATTCTPDVTAGTPYLQASACGTQATKYALDIQPASGSGAFSMQTKTCSAGTLAPKREYYVHIYFVATENGRGDNVPTLKRLELVRDSSGAAPRFDVVPLVEGIENLQLMYGVDTNADGAPDEYVSDPTSVGRWMDVMTVQFNILARNIETAPNYVDTKTYTLGKDSAGTAQTVGPFNDGYRRHVYSGLVRIMNPAGRRDTP
jgi:type IV pilus assembly protein PilW